MVAPSMGVYGGIEVFTTHIAKEVAKHGKFDVRVVFRVRADQTDLPQIAEELKKIDINLRVIRKLDWQFFKDLLWADLIHCHFPLMYATFPAKLLRKKLVITIENQYDKNHHSWLHCWGLKIADVRWYISSFVADTWENKTRMIHSLIVPAASDLPYHFCNPNERKGFFFIARWVPLKGIEQLIEAYATAKISHKEHPLYLLGDGPLRESCEALIMKFGIREHIYSPGFVSHDEKCDFMSNSRWNIAPAAFPEDLGLSPIEARSCGVPSIVSKTGGLPEAAGGDALFCKPGDVESLRTAIETAASMDEAEYHEKSLKVRDSLKEYLVSDDFYTGSFSEILND